jgi:hypothetical protein
MNRIRKSGNEQVQTAATKVLMKWKDVMLPASSSASGSEKKRRLEATEEPEGGEETEKVKVKGEGEGKGKGKGVESGGLSSATVSSSSTVPGSPSSAAPGTLVSFTLQSFYIGDGVRDKCFEMLVSALMVDQQRQLEAAEEDSGANGPITPDEIVITTAQSIERCLFAEFQAVTPAYKAKFRSKYLNLNDRNNPTLRNALISGMINAERFCQMTAAVRY